jgi:HEAT repeat protein
LLKDESGGIRVKALATLMLIGDPSALPAIQKCLNDPKWDVRQNACLACGLFAGAKAKRKLTQLSKLDERKAARIAALAALEKL